MAIELLKPWNGFPAGHKSEAFGAGVEDLLIQRGIAREIITGNRDGADSGTDHVERSQKAPRNKRK